MTCKLDSCAQTWYDPIGAHKSGLVLPQLRHEIHSIYGEQDSSRHAHWPASLSMLHSNDIMYVKPCCIWQTPELLPIGRP